jgi:glucokinase
MGTTNDRPFVVVSDLPGSGKTTVARRLAPALSLPLLDKDEVLERLFDSKGTGDGVWRRTLSRESDALLQSEATASRGAVLASFWHLPGMPADSGTPTAWLAELSDLVVNVRCACPAEVAAARFFGRKRHAGHLDTESTFAEVLASVQALARRGPLTIEPAIELDTSDEYNLDTLVRDIQAAFTRCRSASDSPRKVRPNEPD